MKYKSCQNNRKTNKKLLFATIAQLVEQRIRKQKAEINKTLGM